MFGFNARRFLLCICPDGRRSRRWCGRGRLRGRWWGSSRGDSRALRLSERRRMDFGVLGAEAFLVLDDGQVGFVEDLEDDLGDFADGDFGAGAEVEF